MNVEIALVLEVIAQVGQAAHQQIAVDRLFIEYRNVLLQVPLGYFRAAGLHLDLGPAVGLDRGLHAIAGRLVIGMVHGDRGGEPLILVVFSPYVLQPAQRVLRGCLLPTEPALILRGLGHLFLGKHGIARDYRRSQAGALARCHLEGDRHLLMLGVASDLRLNRAQVQPVALQ